MTTTKAPADDPKPYFIVWNGDRSEGFVTDDEADAKSATTGRPHAKLGYRSQSTAGLAFFEAYEDEKLSVHKVTLGGTSARPEGDGWKPIETAPYGEVVRVRVGKMDFAAVLSRGGSLDDNGQTCDQWVAAYDGQHPPCWTDGACWASNEDEVTSLPPSAWRTAQSVEGEG